LGGGSLDRTGLGKGVLRDSFFINAMNKLNKETYKTLIPKPNCDSYIG
jgi:hypothetical protein